MQREAETVNEKLYFQGNIAGKSCEQTLGFSVTRDFLRLPCSLSAGDTEWVVGM